MPQSQYDRSVSTARDPNDCRIGAVEGSKWCKFMYLRNHFFQEVVFVTVILAGCFVDVIRVWFVRKYEDETFRREVCDIAVVGPVAIVSACPVKQVDDR